MGSGWPRSRSRLNLVIEWLGGAKSAADRLSFETGQHVTDVKLWYWRVGRRRIPAAVLRFLIGEIDRLVADQAALRRELAARIPDQEAWEARGRAKMKELREPGSETALPSDPAADC